ncbi:hypothetical protein AB0M94_38890 [Streptomyces xanthochromogenes]|uniref:hypothetical protein n=1 Tax=Streptomyces xanthochromogenes TaxID=67384 RepID=UPI003419B2BC
MARVWNWTLIFNDGETEYTITGRSYASDTSTESSVMDGVLIDLANQKLQTPSGTVNVTAFKATRA